MTQNAGLVALPEDKLIALELRYWNAMHNAAPSVRAAHKQRWLEVIREVRRRQVFDRLIWK